METVAPHSASLLLRLGIRFGLFATIARWLFGQRIAAVMGLTWKAAFRFRLFLVIAVLLLGSVVGLPLLITKDDGTARGLTQILLTYSLSTITALLGLSTLWLACGTLARDIEECQIQVVATKPIARWQIWLGKWLGIMSLNAALLALSGAGVYGLLMWRAAGLPDEQKAILDNEVLVARGSAKPPTHERIIQELADRRLREEAKKQPLSDSDLALRRRELIEQIKAPYQVVQPGYRLQWKLQVKPANEFREGEPLYVRAKFNSGRYGASTTFPGCGWLIGAPGQDIPPRALPLMSLTPDTFHEFQVPSELVAQDGTLTITFENLNDTPVVFPMDEGIEVLYRESGFTLNFLRGLAVIFCWMALLAALGLASASFLSFPVAAFLSLGLLTLALCSGTMANAVADSTIMGVNEETGVAGHSIFDNLMTRYVFPAVLGVINLVKEFAPIDSLSTGRSITWGQLGQAFAQIVLFLGGLISLAGIAIFTRRELATAQGTQ